MTIDILSDLHVDFYFKLKRPKPETVEAIYSHIFYDNQKRDTGDVLIIAGDIGHYNMQNIKVLEHIKEVFGYKHIICVLGNHDYYLIDESTRKTYHKDSFLRAAKMRDLINKREGMHCLNGEIVEIDGVRFGGCDGWYDGEYIKKNFEKICPMWNIPKDDYYILEFWKNSQIDSRYIHGIDWQEYAQHEKQKIEKIYKDVDVMITHINPSIQKEHISVSFRECETTGFFTFDGSKYLKEGSMKYWIFGHTHTDIQYEIDGVKCICNPMGYPGENGNGEWTWIKSIEV